ncbi:MAG: hypothetical protein ACO3C5_08080 [Ilumatobacteraceae bacterium]
MKKTSLLGVAISATVLVSLVGSRVSPAQSSSMPVAPVSSLVPINPIVPASPVCKSSAAPIDQSTILDSLLAANNGAVSGCGVGSRGPGGGVVFYDAGGLKWWGRYLEAVVLSSQSNTTWSSRSNSQTSLYTGDAATVQRQRVDAKAIGMGRINTELIVQQSGPGVYAAIRAAKYRRNGLDDWFLPSKDELNALYDYKALSYGKASVANLAEGTFWSSTEAWKNIAWYQIFNDGTQFSDSYILASKGGNKGRTSNIQYPGTSYPGRPYQVVAVRAFPQGTGEVPVTSFPKLTGNSCTNEGPCAVGDIGPAGGVVFYDAGRSMSWGRYLEVSPKEAEKIGWPWRKPGYSPESDRIYDEKGEPSRIKRVRSKAVGMGWSNTRAIVNEYGRGKYAARAAWDYTANGYDDWFLPSADELELMYNVLYAVEKPLIAFAPTYYWSSSEYDLKNAWTVLFRSGQRFDREGWFTTKDTGKPNAMRVRPIRAFG